MPTISGVRTRRTHTKSRNGCLRCKRLRKKCDELAPRCTRCIDLDQVCRYSTPNLPIDGNTKEQPEETQTPAVKTTYLDIPAYHEQYLISPSLSAPQSDGPSSETDWSSPDTWLGHSDANEHNSIQNGFERQTSSQSLDGRDLELLSHYLTHTSRTIPFDTADLHALHVGFPNLAFKSKPLMSSILALAAACKCHDMLLSSSSFAALDLAEIQELLQLAERHHMTSLRLTRETIPTADKYDYILANATLMVCYGSASHCIKIKLTEMLTKEAKVVAAEILPTHSQWTSLIRAVHVAYLGLLTVEDGDEETSAQDGNEDEKLMQRTHQPSGTSPEPLVREKVVHPEDGPSPQTRALFLPVVAETAAAAMKKLRKKLEVEGLRQDMDANPGLPACWEAFLFLEMTMKAVFPAKYRVRDDVFDLHQSSMGFGFKSHVELTGAKLPSHIAPWLRNYLTRVTSGNDASSAPLRRSVMLFLNNVSETYMHLVQTTLDQTPAQNGNNALSVAHQTAVDIFAHWLVLMMLLDGVWWIGGIGLWELGKVVAFMRENCVVEELGDVWWPESMYNIRKSLRQQGI